MKILKFCYLSIFFFFSFSNVSKAQNSYFDQSGTMRVLIKPAGQEKKHISKEDYRESIIMTNDIEYKIIPSYNGSWGYDIYSNKKLIIHQPIVPGVQTKDGFSTKEQAKRVALIVVKKIKNGEFPPTINTEDINSLKAIP